MFACVDSFVFGWRYRFKREESKINTKIAKNVTDRKVIGKEGTKIS